MNLKLNFNNKHGEIPGSLNFVGEQKQDFTRIRVIAFNENEVVEETLENLDQIEGFTKKYAVVWINLDGLHDKTKIGEIGNLFDVHPLILEDVMHTDQHPKIQIESDHLFTIFKMLSLEESRNYIDSEQFSLFLKGNVLLTFQEKSGDVFESVRERIRKKTGRVRSKNADYLAFALLDCLSDNYAYIMDYFATKVEDLEEKVLKDPKSEVLHMINTYQIELNYLRKIVRPTRDMLVQFNKKKSEIFEQETYAFMYDLGETIQRVYENVESYKSELTDLLNVYSTHVNHKLNGIMKVLTIFSAIFIPLTFIAGIYGTNFEYLPELKFKYSYFVMLGIMLLLVIGMLFYFKKKRWL